MTLWLTTAIMPINLIIAIASLRKFWRPDEDMFLIGQIRWRVADLFCAYLNMLFVVMQLVNILRHVVRAELAQ